MVAFFWQEIKNKEVDWSADLAFSAPSDYVAAPDLVTQETSGPPSFLPEAVEEGQLL